MRGDEGGRLVRESGGKVLAGRAVAEARVTVRREIAATGARRAPFAAAFVDVESLILWMETFGAEVPLAGKEGRVASRLERFGERRFRKWQPVDIRSGQQARLAWPLLGLIGAIGTDVVGDAEALRIFTRQDAGSRRRADGA